MSILKHAKIVTMEIGDPHPPFSLDLPMGTAYALEVVHQQICKN
jgi:hypothetical protein